MKLRVAVSAAAPVKFKAGARVAVEFDDDEWYLGNVSKVATTWCRVEMDFGESEVIRNGSSRVLEVVSEKKRKRPMLYADVKAIQPAAIAKAEKAEKAKSKRDAVRKQLEDEEQKKIDLLIARKKSQKADEAKKVRFKQLAPKALRVLRKWGAPREFDLKFKPNAYPYGVHVVSDKKLRILAYLYDTVKIYALPPTPQLRDGMSEDELKQHKEEVERLDSIEWGHAEFTYDKFTGEAFQAFIEKLVEKVGHRLKYLLAPVDPDKVIEKPTAAKSDVKVSSPVKVASTNPSTKAVSVKTPVKRKRFTLSVK